MSSGNDINPKVGLDVSGFKAGIAELNRNIRVIESEFKAASSGMEEWQNSSEGLQAKIKSLSGTTEEHRKKLKLLKNQYEKVSKEKGEASAQAKNLEARLNNEQAALNRVEKELEDTKKALKEFENGSASAEAKVKFLTERVEKLNAVGSKLNRYVTVPMTALIGVTTMLGLELEATDAKFETVFGNWSSYMEDYIGEWQNLVAITQTDARNVASGFQDMFVPMKFGREYAQGLTEATMTVVGALTNFNSARFDAVDVSEYFTAALKGEYDSIDSVGIITDKTAVKLRAVELGLASSTKEVSKQAEVLAFLNIAYEQSGDALAAFNETQLDAKTQMNIAIAGLKDEGAELGQNLIPIVTKSAQTLNTLIDSYRELSPEAKKAMLLFAGTAAVTGPLITITAKLIGAYTVVRSAILAQNKELDKNTKKTLVNIAMQKGQGSALFQAGLMATGKAAAVSALGIAETAAIGPTYALGAAVRFLTGPWGIALTLIGAAIPLISSFSKQTKEATSEIDDVTNSTLELEAQLQSLTENATVDDIDVEVNASVDTEAAKNALAKYRNETASTLAEILLMATETEEGITAKVIEEYKKRTDEARLELDKRRSEELEAFIAQSAQIGSLSQEQINDGLKKINEKYDSEISISESHYETLETVLTEHYSKENGLTEEGWAMLQESYVTGQNSLVKASEESSKKIEDFALNMYESMNTMTDERLAENVEIAKGYYSQVVADAAAVKDAQIAFAIEQRDVLGTITAEEAELKIASAQAQYENTVYWASISKSAVINTALETLAERNQINGDEYLAVSTANQNIIDAEQEHNNRLTEINDTYTQAILESGNDRALVTQAYIDKQAALEEEEALHKENMVALYLEQETALSSLDTSTQEAFLSMLTTAQEEGVNITTEVQTMVDTMVETVDISQEMYDSGTDSVQGYIDGLRSKLEDARAAAVDLANAVIIDFDNTLDIRSPSRRLMKSGAYSGDGVIIGLKSKESELRETVDGFAGIIASGLNPKLTNNLKVSIADAGIGLSNLMNNSSSNDGVLNSSSSVISNDNRKTISPKLIMTVKEGIDSFKYRQEANYLLRQAATLIAKG